MSEINQTKVVPKKRVVKSKKETVQVVSFIDSDLFTLESNGIVKIDDKPFPLYVPPDNQNTLGGGMGDKPSASPYPLVLPVFDPSDSESEQQPILNPKEQAKLAKEKAKEQAKLAKEQAKLKAKEDAKLAKEQAKAKAKEDAKLAKEQAKEQAKLAKIREKEDAQTNKTLQSKQLVEKYKDIIMSIPCFLIQILFNYTIPANLIVLPSNLPDDYFGLTVFEAVVYNLFDVYVLQTSSLIRNRVFAFNEYIFKTVFKHLKTLESNDLKLKKEQDKIDYNNAILNKQSAYIAIGLKSKDAKIKAKADVDADLLSSQLQRHHDFIFAPSKYAFKLPLLNIDDPIISKLPFNVETLFAQHFDIANAHLGILNTHLLLDVVKFYFANGCSPSSTGSLNLFQIKNLSLLNNNSSLDIVLSFINSFL